MNHDNWFAIAIVAFFGGIVSNICRPARRGVLGFLASGIVSVFCGSIAAVCSKLEVEQQVLLAAIVGVLADRVLTYVLNFEIIRANVNNNTTINSSGPGANIAGNNDGEQHVQK